MMALLRRRGGNPVPGQESSLHGGAMPVRPVAGAESPFAFGSEPEASCTTGGSATGKQRGSGVPALMPAGAEAWHERRAGARCPA